QGMEKVASGKTARLLKLGLPELSRLRKVENPDVKPQEEPPLAEAEVSS
ncbi:histidine kinase, partial [Pseudomonas sp. SIMBA_059]